MGTSGSVQTFIGDDVPKNVLIFRRNNRSKEIETYHSLRRILTLGRFDSLGSTQGQGEMKHPKCIQILNGTETIHRHLETSSLFNIRRDGRTVP